MSKNFRIFLLSFGLLVHLGAITLSGFGFVVCQENNGQTALEMVIANSCCSLAVFPFPVGQKVFNPVSIESSEGPCASCTDTLLTTDDFAVPQGSARDALWQTSTTLWAATPLFLHSFYPILVQHFPKGPELRFCAAEAVLSSTILRI